MARRFVPLLLVGFALILPSPLLPQGRAQLQMFGRIVGQLRILRADAPGRRILVELQHRGAAMDSIYADAQGHFYFNNLPGGEYYVVIRDEAFDPVQERVQVNPDVNPYTMVQITLRPKEEARQVDPIGSRASGGNPYLVDPDDYNKRFPKKALKEYERGLDADHKGKLDEAIEHYLDALKIAPDYYPAHNNLGSLYLSRSDFKSAEEQFRDAVRLDQNEAQAYLNLGNVLMLTSRYAEAEEAVSAGLQKRPDSAFGKFLRGSLLARSGRYAEAEKDLRDALGLDSSIWQAHLQLVNIYLHQDRRDDAISQLQVFLRAFPSVSAAAKARKLLQKLQTEPHAAQ